MGSYNYNHYASNHDTKREMERRQRICESVRGASEGGEPVSIRRVLDYLEEVDRLTREQRQALPNLYDRLSREGLAKMTRDGWKATAKGERMGMVTRPAQFSGRSAGTSAERSGSSATRAESSAERPSASAARSGSAATRPRTLILLCGESVGHVIELALKTANNEREGHSLRTMSEIVLSEGVTDEPTALVAKANRSLVDKGLLRWTGRYLVPTAQGVRAGITTGPTNNRDVVLLYTPAGAQMARAVLREVIDELVA